MPTIYVDSEVYQWLESQAEGFDTPNAVLRRLGRLATPGESVKRPGRRSTGKLLPLIKAGIVNAGDVLIWERPRKGETHRATITEHGCIVLADGRAFTDPSPAAGELSGGQVNGWKDAWRHNGTRLADLRDRLSP
jgi:hypothetical protein